MKHDDCHYCNFMESFLQCSLCMEGTLCVLHSGWSKRLALRKEEEDNEYDRVQKIAM